MAVAMIGPKFYAWDRNGKPLAFGKLYTYQARTNTPKPTYQSEDQAVENTNPVILNGEGYANVYLDGTYKMVLKDDKDNEVWSSDPVTSAQAHEWVSCLAATYESPSVFKVFGNHTADYVPERAVRIDSNTSVYAYSAIKESSYANGETTVTIKDPVVTTGIVNSCVSIVGPNSVITIDDINANFDKFGTLASFVNDTNLEIGMAVRVTDRADGIFDVVSASSVTPDDGCVVQCVGQQSLALSLRVDSSTTTLRQAGATDTQWHNAYNSILSKLSVFGGTINVDGRFSENSTYNFPKEKEGVVTKGGGLYQSALINLGPGPVIEFGTDPSQKSLSLLDFKDLDIEGGSHGLFMSRTSGDTIAWERMTLSNVRFLNQTDAWVKATGKKVMYLVNTHIKVAGNGVKGFDIAGVFSCNLNHWDFCRFEAMSSYHLYISTTNNECVQNTMRRGRHEANTGNQEQILVQGGSQSFKVEDDYFEDCPTPSITLDASTGLNLATEITGNTLSSNTVGNVFVKLLSQCFDTEITGNVLKPGQTAEIQGNTNCKRIIAHSNGDSTSYTGFAKDSFYATDSDNLVYRESTDSYTFGDFKGEVGEAHAGNFSFSIQLPKQGVYDITTTLKEDGDISLGGVLSIRCAWLIGGAPILGGTDVMKILNPNTANISLNNVSASGLVTFDVDKGGDSTARSATINYTVQTKDFSDIH